MQTDNLPKKNSFDSVEKTNESESFTYDWHGVANTDWDVIHTIKNDYTREDLHPKAREIFNYYESKYGSSDLDCTIIDSLKGDLKDAGFNQCGFPLTESTDQKNFLDIIEKDSNEESVIKVEKPNNIILPDNN